VTPKSTFLKPQFHNKHVTRDLSTTKFLELNHNNKHLQEAEEVSQTKNSSINPQKITFPEWKILDLEEVETRDFRNFGFGEIRKAYAIMKFLNQNLFFSRGRASTAPRSFPYHQRMATTAHHHTCSL
jgi:hypothetical protein